MFLLYLFQYKVIQLLQVEGEQQHLGLERLVVLQLEKVLLQFFQLLYQQEVEHQVITNVDLK